MDETTSAALAKLTICMGYWQACGETQESIESEFVCYADNPDFLDEMASDYAGMVLDEREFFEEEGNPFPSELIRACERYLDHVDALVA